jgi:hypothetical protein
MDGGSAFVMAAVHTARFSDAVAAGSWRQTMKSDFFGSSG